MEGEEPLGRLGKRHLKFDASEEPESVPEPTIQESSLTS